MARFRMFTPSRFPVPRLGHSRQSGVGPQHRSGCRELQAGFWDHNGGWNVQRFPDRGQHLKVEIFNNAGVTNAQTAFQGTFVDAATIVAGINTATATENSTNALTPFGNSAWQTLIR